MIKNPYSTSYGAIKYYSKNGDFLVLSCPIKYRIQLTVTFLLQESSREEPLLKIFLIKSIFYN